MTFDIFLFAGAATAIGGLLAFLWLVRHLQRKNRSVADDGRLWAGRDYRCPACRTPMEQGWALLGKGAIRSSRSRAKPGTFSHIGATLDNTMSMSLRPAVNMAWRCTSCRLLLLDHAKLVRD